jgi:hypothetical protein
MKRNPRIAWRGPVPFLPLCLLFTLVVAGCGSSSAPGSDAGKDAVAASGGSSGGGSGGSGADAAPGTGGGAVDAAGGSGGGGGPMGTQPIGAACANTGNCTQASGAAVCCVNTCLLASECPNNNYVDCDPAPTYACRTGRCCRAMAGGQTIYYCTKSNGCAGTFVP